MDMNVRTNYSLNIKNKIYGIIKDDNINIQTH